MAQVTDTTTFTAEERRAEVDAWLYETCTQCLQHMVDIIALFYTPVAPILPRIFDLLSNFVRCAICTLCPHSCQEVHCSMIDLLHPYRESKIRPSVVTQRQRCVNSR